MFQSNQQSRMNRQIFTKGRSVSEIKLELFSGIRKYFLIYFHILARLNFHANFKYFYAW